MLCITKIDDYLKILTYREVKGCVAISISEHFKSITEGQNLLKL